MTDSGERRAVPAGRAMRAVAGVCGFAAVALGAFGAHALKPTLTALATAETWHTASLYHLVHAAVLACIALARPAARASFWLLAAGTVVFCGSLYAFALTGFKSLAMLAPVGGAGLLAGWLCLACHGRGKVDEDARS